MTRRHAGVGGELDPHDAVTNLGQVTGDLGARRVRANPGLKRKLPLVPRTRHHVFSHVTRREVPAGVRAGIVDHKDALGIIQQKDSQFATSVLHERTFPPAAAIDINQTGQRHEPLALRLLGERRVKTMADCHFALSPMVSTMI